MIFGRKKAQQPVLKVKRMRRYVIKFVKSLDLPDMEVLASDVNVETPVKSIAYFNFYINLQDPNDSVSVAQVPFAHVLTINSIEKS